MASSQDSERHHPRGLYALFLTEMWERFCYYGMRALLILYLVQYHGWHPSHASAIFKWYTSLVYLTPLLGGVLADRVMGLRMSVITGAVLMAFGELSLTFASMPMFYLGLGLLVLGNGFFKPNISTIVGKMYRPGDPRRDRAFTIFYMGINLGAGLSPLL
jgi:POT family proton-dependent oligopeptide transporter